MPATTATSLTATARAAIAGLMEMAPTIVTKAATASSAGWQRVRHSVVRGLRFGAFFGLR